MRTQLSKLALAAAFGLALTFTFSCSSDDDGGGGGNSGGGTCNGSSGINGGNGKGNNIANYKTKRIGDQVWMAENLNYNVTGSRCYGECGQVFVGMNENEEPIMATLSNTEIKANCEKYGRLYDWATAMGIDAKYNKEEWGGSDVKHQGICPSTISHIKFFLIGTKDIVFMMRNDIFFSCFRKATIFTLVIVHFTPPFPILLGHIIHHLICVFLSAQLLYNSLHAYPLTFSNFL